MKIVGLSLSSTAVFINPRASAGDPLEDDVERGQLVVAAGELGRALAGAGGVEATTPTGTTEIRAMYGGLQAAIGLLAAIPAVIAYNKFSADVGKITARLEGFADEFSGILSRQIDERLQTRQAAE